MQYILEIQKWLASVCFISEEKEKQKWACWMPQSVWGMHYWNCLTLPLKWQCHGRKMEVATICVLFLGNGRNSPISIRSFIFFPFPFSENYIEIFDNYRLYFLIWRCRLNFCNNFSRSLSCISSLHLKLEICLLIALVLLLATQIFVHV